MPLADQLRSIVHGFMPKSLVRARKRLQWRVIRKQYSSLPVHEAFSEIYRTKLWGEKEGEAFFSGGGSTEPFAAPYAESVSRFIRVHGIRTVLDLGCGDFRVGKRICSQTHVRYIGIDVVPALIAYNNAHFARDGIEFRCADIIEDDLPGADLCLIREVLQHLSNAQIQKVVARLARYPYVLATEDVYSGRSPRPNLDHTHGPDNRLHKRSGVFLDLPPFNLKTKTILAVPSPQTNSTLRTLLIRNTSSGPSGSRLAADCNSAPA